jgi:hypothetical protein
MKQSFVMLKGQYYFESFEVCFGKGGRRSVGPIV